MRRPVAVLVPTLALPAAARLAVPARPVQRAGRLDPAADVPSRAAFDRLHAEFGEGEFAPIVLAIRTDGPATTPANLAAPLRLLAPPRGRPADRARRQPRRRRPAADARPVPAAYGDPTGRATATSRDPGGHDQGRPDRVHASTRRTARTATRAGRWSRDLRDPAGPLAPPAGMTVLVGGGAADVADVVDRVAADFPRTALFILVTTYLVLFLLLRSVVLPLKALVMNTLSIVASFGALVWIFQDGNLSALLGFQPLGFVETTQPVILFCVLFGLSMDYEVFLLSRMKEAWDRTGDNTEAVAARPRAERPDRHLGGAHRRRGRRGLVRVRRHRADQGARPRRWPSRSRSTRPSSGRCSCPRRCACSAAGTGGCRPARAFVAGRLPRGGGRGGGGDPMSARRRCSPSRCWWPSLARCRIGRLPGRRSSPTRSRPRRRSRRRRRRRRRRRSTPRGPAARRRPARPADRVVVLHRPPRAADGRRFGFEYVIFRAERGSLPASWASHLALTDEAGDRFLYAQRCEVGAAGRPLAARRRRRPDRVRPRVAGRATRRDPATAGRPAWDDGRGDGDGPTPRDSRPGRSGASPAPGRPRARPARSTATKPPALHDRDGWVDFGPAGGSYYYSRTAMTADGQRSTLDGQTLAVTATPGSTTSGATSSPSVAAAGTGSRSTSTTARTSRCRSCATPTAAIRSSTARSSAGRDGQHLPRDAFTVEVTDRWTSPTTGADYPAGWRSGSRPRT